MQAELMSTFLDLTNRLLRRLNEVEIAQEDFGSVRNVQALAKDAINDSINEINSAEFRWPFNSAETSVTLVAGTSEYSWPADFKVPEWNSFQVQPGAGIANPYSLTFIEQRTWYRKLRDNDVAAGVAGAAPPRYVFPGHGLGFGVSPVPDAAYALAFRYWRKPAVLVAHDDSPSVPDTFDHVILAGGLFHFYMFRDNPESAQLAATKFRQGIKEMQSVLINRYHSVTDTRVRF